VYIRSVLLIICSRNEVSFLFSDSSHLLYASLLFFSKNFMGNETNLMTFSIVLGIILTIGLSIVIWTLGSAYAKSDKLQYEISDCSV
jgi:uncharacterized membrane protein (DUF485 family)